MDFTGIGGIGLVCIVCSRFSPSQRIVPFCSSSTTTIPLPLLTPIAPERRRAASICQLLCIESLVSVPPLNLIVKVGELTYCETETLFHPVDKSVNKFSQVDPFLTSTRMSSDPIVPPYMQSHWF